MKKDNYLTERGCYIKHSKEAADAAMKFFEERDRNPTMEEPPEGQAWPRWRVYFDPSPRLPKDRESHPVHLQHWGRPEYRNDYGHNFKRGPDFERCSAHVMSNYAGGQCSKKAKHDPDHTGKPTRCTIHSRDYRAKKEAEQRARWSAEAKSRDAAARRRRAADGALALIEKIADGHNDPRGAAQDLLIEFGLRQPPDETY